MWERIREEGGKEWGALKNGGWRERSRRKERKWGKERVKGENRRIRREKELMEGGGGGIREGLGTEKW